MLKRILLGIIVVASLGWILFIGYDIFTNGNDFNESYLFGTEDEQIIIVNRFNETDFGLIDEFHGSANYDYILTMNDSLVEKIFCSYKREHFLVDGKENWNKETISALFKLLDLPVSDFTESTFKIGDRQGKYRKDRLYVSKENIELNSTPLPYLAIDQKSSASIVSFGEKNTIASIKDVYFKTDNKVEYITRDKNLTQGKQVNDGLLFGAILSARIDSYQFYERDYYALQDSVFAVGPMVNWLNNGFALVSINGEKAIISDYIDGQDPILILNDIQQTIDSNYFSTPLLSDFSSARGYYVKYLDEAVVISSKEAVCDQLIADFKLGNTLAISGTKREMIFGGLPREVSERTFNGEVHQSKSVYNGYLLETVLGLNLPTEIETNNDPTALACNFEIIDFEVFGNRGNAIAISPDGEIVAFKAEKELFSTKVEGRIFDGVEIIDLHGNGQIHFMVTTDEAIYLWNEKGQVMSGFPIKPDSELTSAAKFYRWKGKSYFLVSTQDNKVYHFDAQGREIDLFKTKVEITAPIEVWASQNKLFAGFSDGKTFEMFSIESNSSYRTFSLPINSISAKIPNELIHFAMENDVLTRVDQKGTKTHYQKYTNGKILKVTDSKSPVIIIKKANELHFVNEKGISFGSIRLSFNEIEDIFYYSSDSGKTSVAIIDGLENNVYLYNLKGELLTDKALEGSRKILLTKSTNSIVKSTIVGQFIVQY